MADRPILYSAPMIRAKLAGLKSQTRRVLKPQPTSGYKPWRDEDTGQWFISGYGEAGDWALEGVRFAVGDRLWARETWQYAPQKYCTCSQGSEPAPCDDWSNGTGCRSNRAGVIYRADKESLTRWRPSIFMPRWASRITDTITDVRVQRLQDIDADDAAAEGLHYIEDGPGAGFWVVDGTPVCGDGTVETYAQLWDHINGAGSWDANPWVVAITSTTELRNIDARQP